MPPTSVLCGVEISGDKFHVFLNMAEPMVSVCRKDHTCELASAYKSLLENNFLVDCTLSAEGRSLKAHRLVLSASSPYFHVLFQEETGKHPFVILLDASFETLKAVIDFVYQGETQIPDGNLKAFMALAQSLQIKGLNAFSQDKKNKNLSRNTAENVCCGPSEDNEDTYGVQCVSARQKDSPEDSSQHHPDHSDHFVDYDRPNTVPFEAFNALSDEVQSEFLITPQTPVGYDEASEDTEIIVKEDPLFSELSETVSKGLDNIKRNETLSANFTSEMVGGTCFLFPEQYLNKHSSCGGSFHGNVESPVITHLRQQCMQSNEVASGRDVAENCQPLQPVTLVPQSEQIDDVESKENMDEFDVLGSDMNEICEETEHPYGEQSLNQFSSADGLPLEEELATQRRSLAGQQSESSPPNTELQSHEGRHAHPGGQTLPSDEGGTAPAHSPNKRTHEPRRAGEGRYRCEVCEKFYLSASKLTIHMRIHTGERPYRCEHCGKTFRVKWTLSIHMRTHTGERPFRCEVCAMTFTVKGNYNTHMRKHAGARPYRCKICGKSFAEKAYRVKHMRMHAGERPYRCDTCGKTFLQKGGLVGHMRMHTGERPFRCDFCGKRFSLKCVLVIHMRRHTGERP